MLERQISLNILEIILIREILGQQCFSIRTIFLNDGEISAVLPYIRQNFGNDTPAISTAEVSAKREELQNQTCL